MTLQRLAVPAISLMFIGGAAVASAPVIGMASSQNGLTLNHFRVSGDATLFDGSTVETSGYSRIHLKNGTRLDLAAGSSAQVFANRETLESGTSEVQSASGFEISARTLSIRPSDAASIVRVKLDGGNKVLVTALNSPVNVSNKEGFLVARVMPGVPFSFLPQAAGGSGNTFDATGCVLQKGDSLIWVDQTGTQIYELKSAKKAKFSAKFVGSKDRVAGVIDSAATPSPSSGAMKVLVVGGMSVSEKGGCTDVASKVGASAVATGTVAIATTAGADGAAATAAATSAGVAPLAAGVSTGLIIGGVAAGGAAAIGGAIAATHKSGNS